MTGRGWIGFGAAGCAVVLGCAGEWRAVAVASVVALMVFVLWLRGELAAGRAEAREHMAAGKHRKRGLLRTAAGLPRRVLAVVGLW